LNVFSMKKLYFVFCLLIMQYLAAGQTVPGGDMETWRSSFSGGTLPVTVQAPYAWYGADSLVIADGQFFGLILGISPTVWKRQLFMENTIIHGGAHAAKVMTRDQDTLGIFPGILSNAKANVPISPSGPGTPTYSGGSPTSSLKITSVSAWVAYFPGRDTTTHALGGPDTASMTVQVLGTLRGKDTLVGRGIIQIPHINTYTQVTANIFYFDTTRWVDTIRITFASSGGGSGGALDSSTLFVDDVTMIGVAQDTLVVVDTTDTTSHEGISNLTRKPVSVYPNPASNVIYLESGTYETMHFELLSVTGVRITSRTIIRKGSVDISDLPTGTYLYRISDDQGNIVQRDKLLLER
jgi:hypothetical protein